MFKTVLTLAVAALLWVPHPAVAKSRPNILVIVADDMGYNDIGYHNPKMKTPNLDRLARAAVELDCHYVQPVCTPTRVALMTGRYPSRHGLHCCGPSNRQAFPIGTLTLASMLKSRGYATGMSGKWHLGSKPEWGPNHYGFDYSHGSLTGAVGMYDHRYRLNSPFSITWHRNGKIIDGHEDGTHATDLTAAETVRWIESHTDAAKPWMFYVPFHAVHTPLVERDKKWTEMNRHFESADRRLFAAAVSHMDAAVGLMVDALKKTRQLDRTLILFTSDNGAQVGHAGNTYPPPDPKLSQFSSNKPLRGKKATAYEGGYRVPAFIYWPDKLAARKESTPMHVVDWLPTLAGLVGYQPADDPKWDGRNVWTTLAGEKAAPQSRTFYIVVGSRQWEAVRSGDWKIVRRRGQPWEMYNVARDPNETTDLAERNVEQRDRLIQVYQRERAKDAKAP